jgi:ribosomal protein S18 acetylase RimI-like enzyme
MRRTAGARVALERFERAGAGTVLAMVSIRRVEAVGDDVVEAFDRLVPQLSSSNPPPGRSGLEEIVSDPRSHLLVARDDDGTILGTLTLVFFRIPTGLQARIEDVVVDGSARGRGIGEELTLHAVDVARAAGAGSIGLTSRPSREAANRLYRRLGFEQRETNVYRLKL